MGWILTFSLIYLGFGALTGIYYFAFISGDYYREEEEAGLIAPEDAFGVQVLYFVVFPVLAGLFWPVVWYMLLITYLYYEKKQEKQLVE